MDKGLLKAFWNCGDTHIIDFAILRARLNRQEKEVVTMMLDECMTQEETAEALDLSTRKVQSIWASASSKLLAIEWLTAYARELRNRKDPD